MVLMTRNQSTTYQRNQHITILRAVLRVIGGPTVFDTVWETERNSMLGSFRYAAFLRYMKREGNDEI
jgi:hypothetical protein